MNRSNQKEFLNFLYERMVSVHGEHPNFDYMLKLKEMVSDSEMVVQPSQFEIDVKKAAEKSVLKLISEGSWLAPDYTNRFKVPPEWVTQCWQLVDKERIQEQMARRIEEELADRMVNHMASELATDIKQILSVKERREALRALARAHIDSIMGAQ